VGEHAERLARAARERRPHRHLVLHAEHCDRGRRSSGPDHESHRELVATRLDRRALDRVGRQRLLRHRGELRVTTDSTTALDFAAGSRTDLPAPHLAGTPERFPFQAASLGTRFFLAIRAKDAAGNIGAGSNVAPITTPGSSGLAVNTLALRSAGDSTLTLQWSAPPGVWYYDLRGSTTPMDAGSYFTAPLRIDVLAAGAPIDTAKISSLEPGSTWWFALRPIDLTGNAGPVSNVMSAGVPVGGALHGKSGVALAVRGQPARIPAWFDWQGGGAGIRSAIDLYDLSGRHVRTIELPGGRFGGTMEWNGRDDDQRLVPAGLYFARLTCGSIHAQARVVLLP